VELCLTYILSEMKYTCIICLSVCSSNPILFVGLSIFTGLRLCNTNLERGKMNRLYFSCNVSSCKLPHVEDSRYSAHFRSDHLTRLASTIFGTVSAVFRRIQALCDVPLCRWGSGYRRIVGILCFHLDGSSILRNVGEHPTTQCESQTRFAANSLYSRGFHFECLGWDLALFSL
jgi:hypothetical protein